MHDKDIIRQLLLSSGAIAVGFAEAALVDKQVISHLKQWVKEGKHAGMEYMVRHAGLKNDPGNVLPGVKTVISLAFNFNPSVDRDTSLPVIASYALGDDYHDVIRARLSPLVDRWKNEYGGDWRICIDSAPLAERFWAVRSGIGSLGDNGMVIVEGYGSRVFLAEILTSIPLPPDSHSSKSCLHCGKCVAACPGNALQQDGTLDCRRCISYLTIEHRGEWDDTGKKVMSTPAGRNTLYGCDRCVAVCPLNTAAPPSEIPEFQLRPTYASLTKEKARTLTQQEFSTLFKGSPIKRTRLPGLLRNTSPIS